LKELRAKYVAYIEQMLTLGVVSDAKALAHEIMTFETAASKVQWPIEKRRDVDATYNPRSKEQLLAFAPGFPWQPFFAAMQLGAREDLVLGELSAIRDMAERFGRSSVPPLRGFLTFHYLSSHATYLPKRFDEARFAFYGQAMHGQPQQRERWKRAVDAVDGALGESIGRLYVAQYFPPESKAKMQQLVADLRTALGERIDALDWMTPQTKSRAHEKLAMFMPKIGYPDKWKDYATLVIRRDDLIGNVRRAVEWDWNYQVARLDKPVDRAEWHMTPQTVNAYYNPSNNEIVFPAAILQPPFFDPNADAAVNYGAIGAVIGLERGSAVFPRLRAGVAQQVPRRRAARAGAVRRAQPGGVPRQRTAAQHRRLVRGVQRAAGRQALHQAGQAGADLVVPALRASPPPVSRSR